MTVQASITCPHPACRAKSYNPGDIRYQYCGRCRRYHADIIRTLRQDIAQGFERLSAEVSEVGPWLSKWAGRGEWALLPDNVRDNAGTNAMTRLDAVIAALTGYRDRLAEECAARRIPDSATATP